MLPPTITSPECRPLPMQENEDVLLLTTLVPQRVSIALATAALRTRIGFSSISLFARALAWRPPLDQVRAPRDCDRFQYPPWRCASRRSNRRGKHGSAAQSLLHYGSGFSVR